MTIDQIQPRMLVSHITDVTSPKQKLIVVYNRSRTSDEKPIKCEWFSNSGNYQSDWFRPEDLELYTYKKRPLR